MNDPLNFAQLDLNYLVHLPEDREAIILDLGCGRGRFISYLQSKKYSRILGIDRDPHAVAWVKANVTPDVELVDDLLAFLAGSPAKYDLIIAKDVIYYFPHLEIRAYISAIKNALKPGGRLLVEVFNGATFTGPYIMYKDYDIQWIPSEHGVRSLLEDSGLRVTRMFGVRPSGKGIKNWVFSCLAGTWIRILKLIYLLERGLDAQNPKIFNKCIVAIAENHDQPPRT